MEIIGGPEGSLPYRSTFGRLVLRGSTEIFLVCDAMIAYPQYDYDAAAFEQVMKAIEAATRPLIDTAGNKALLPVILPSDARPLITTALDAYKQQVPNESDKWCIDHILSQNSKPTPERKG